MTDVDPGGEVLSVAQLARLLKRAVETMSGEVWVEGEVVSAKAAASGHLYFGLKDEREEALLDCVMYRGAGGASRRLVQDGARVRLRGRASVYVPRGRLQFVATDARAAGRGALLEALERLKAKLAAEGLFSPDRKRPLPPDPAVVGVVTSRSGAAIHDIARVAFRRGGVRILLSPALVQGEGAPRSLVEALDLLERVRSVELIVVGRGGGASDDLMAFNDEAVVRRVAACRVPVVSAVGHEIDVTLCDLAADARAATPSQAAELVVPDAAERRERLAQARARLVRAVRSRLREDRADLGRLRASIGAARVIVAERRQLADERAARLRRVGLLVVSRRRETLARMDRRLAGRHPRAVVAAARASLGPLRVRLVAVARARVERARASLGGRAARLEAMSPLGVLGRGYAIATRADGRAVRRAAELRRDEDVRVRVHRGAFTARVGDVDEGDGDR